jgi:hypothetical protein
MAFCGDALMMSIGHGENIVSAGSLIPGTRFSFLGDDIQIGALPCVLPTSVPD